MNLHYDPHNIFAKILTGDITAKIITQSNHALAFHDAFPKAPIHALVIPKRPYITMAHFLACASQSEILDFWGCVQKTVNILNIETDGFRMISNCGVHGGQEVPHMHIHILGGESMGPMLCTHK